MKRWQFYLGLAVLLAAVAAVLMPMYGDYAVRARVSEGISSAMAYRTQVAEAIVDQGKLPLDPARVPKVAPGTLAKSVQSLTIGRNGELHIRFTGHSSIEGRSIVYVPVVDKAGLVAEWQCYNIDMPERELPAACRAKRPR